MTGVTGFRHSLRVVRVRPVQTSAKFGVVSILVALLAACTNGGSDARSLTCNIYGRDTPGQRLRGERVTLNFPRDRAVLKHGSATVHLTTLTEEGTAGSLVVAIVDEAKRELARGHYQLKEEVRDQFGGGHGFTGLVIWRNPATGAEIQYYCGAA
jgi:hypothetical protein